MEVLKTALRHFYQIFVQFTEAMGAFFAHLSEYREALAMLMTENFDDRKL